MGCLAAVTPHCHPAGTRRQGSGSGQNLCLDLRDLCPWAFAPNF